MVSLIVVGISVLSGAKTCGSVWVATVVLAWTILSGLCLFAGSVACLLARRAKAGQLGFDSRLCVRTLFHYGSPDAPLMKSHMQKILDEKMRYWNICVLRFGTVYALLPQAFCNLAIGEPSDL